MYVLLIYEELLVLYSKATRSRKTISLWNLELISSNHQYTFP